MDTLFKAIIAYFVFSFGLAIGIASADHTTGLMAGAPEPVQECYAKAQIYQQLAITRRAGLTLEETTIYYAYTMRIVKYVTEASGEIYDDAEQTEQDKRAREVFAISDEDIASDAYISDWVTVKYDECIALIPDEISPTDNSQSIDRMLLPE